MSYKAVGTFCFVPLGTTVDAMINGIDARMDRVMALNGAATCEVVEPRPNLFAIVNLAPAIADRGWLDAMDRIQIVQTRDSVALACFRTTVRDLIAFASAEPELATDPAMLRHMEQSLLASLDDVMASPSAIPTPGNFDHYLRIVRTMEEHLTFHPSADMYGDELAQACGVSLRTLQTATRAVRGSSVHRYLRMRRLWLVRCTLALGRRLKISDVARANGFWHMGEFSTAYRTAFGETPSETLARNS